MTDRHIMEQAKGKVFVENGKVVGAEEPKVKWCPLHKIMYGREVYHTKEFIMEHVRDKINEIGMFTPHRIVECDRDTILFGASEILMCAKQKGIIECAVLACDCAGTVIATTDKLIQGIGERLAGLVETSPIKEVIDRIEQAGDTLWTKTFGDTIYDYGFSVQQTADGGFIIAGGTESFDAGEADVYLIRTDANGNALWTKTFGATKCFSP